jgi:hypothetical protein
MNIIRNIRTPIMHRAVEANGRRAQPSASPISAASP